VQAAVDCGLDGNLVRNLLAGDADMERVTQEAESAKEAGIDGVPCFIFGNVLAVSGAQAPEYLADAIRRAAGEYARRTTQQVEAAPAG
jgi:predicted DsbA family dithiol-disulfide isomerase